MKFNALILLFVILLSSCDEKRSTQVLTKPEFTNGIEGPAVRSNGDLFLVNYEKEGTIGIIPEGAKKAQLFVELKNGSVGNGIRFGNDSVFFVADYVNHNVLKINANSKETSVFVHSNDMNQPNDLAISSNGTLYLSDPNWKDKTGQLWKVSSTGELSLLEQGMGTTNGVEVSMDDKYLYVNESIQRKVWKYTIDEKGNVFNKVLLHQFNDFGLDGMRSDQAGNLYIARYDKGVVAVLNPSGELIREIKLHGKKPTNVAFGGTDGKTVFVTMQEKKWVEAFQAEHAGRAMKLK